MERLQKYMARCGVASRRKAEEMIAEGRVKVNGEVINIQGFKVKARKNELLSTKTKARSFHI